MRTVGIIAEYNPFHTGHEYHIRQAKELTGADYAVVVMSPDFVQRGEPAIFDKYTRTKMALSGGADLVLELPVCYAAGSAEFFAQGAVSFLDRLGIADVLCFGAETDDLSLFLQAGRTLAEEPEEYKAALKEGMKKGLTFPQARSAALSVSLTSQHGTAAYQEIPESLSSSRKKTRPVCGNSAEFLETPNNILGIEYCKALYKRRSRIAPFALKRRGSDYNSPQLSGSFCSASALRRGLSDNSLIDCQTDRNFGHGAVSRRYQLNENSWKTIRKFVPENCQKLFREAARTPITAEDMLPYLQLRLLDASSPSHRKMLREILDISPDLADRIEKLCYPCIGKAWGEVVSLLKTKQITEARIRRALLHLILDIRTEDVACFRQNGTAFYAHILGFRKAAAPLLHEIKESSAVPLIAKAANAAKILDDCAVRMWEMDLYASHLYRTIQTNIYAVPFRTEYEYSPVIL